MIKALKMHSKPLANQLPYKYIASSLLKHSKKPIREKYLAKQGEMWSSILDSLNLVIFSLVYSTYISLLLSSINLKIFRFS